MHVRHGADNGEERDGDKLDPIRERAKVPWIARWSVTTLNDVLAVESRCLGKRELTHCRDAGPEGVVVVCHEYSDEVNHARNAIVTKIGASGAVEDQVEVGAHGEGKTERDSHKQGADQVYRSTNGVLGPKFEGTPN